MHDITDSPFYLLKQSECQIKYHYISNSYIDARSAAPGPIGAGIIGIAAGSRIYGGLLWMVRVA